MFLKNCIILVSAIMIQTIAAQCLRSPYNVAYTNEIAAANLAAETAALASAAAAGIYGPIANSLAYTPVIETAYQSCVPGLTFGLTLGELSASNGNGLRIKSGSPIPPSGVTVESDAMLIEGPLAVSGQVPFLGVVALEGPLPATGTGAVAYGCGNGNVGIVNESVAPVAPVASVAAVAPVPAYAYAGYPGVGPFPNTLAGFPNGLSLAGFPAGPGCGIAAVY